MGLRNECPGRKGQDRPGKGQEEPTEIKMPLGAVAAGPSQCISRIPVGMRGDVEVILRRTPVYWRKIKSPISISPAVL
jgi:hypothetical protein